MGGQQISAQYARELTYEEATKATNITEAQRHCTETQNIAKMKVDMTAVDMKYKYIRLRIQEY